MPRFVIWVEGVDFDATVYDSNHLSVVRGASLALLQAPERAEEHLKRAPDLKWIKRVFAGGSQGAFIVEGEAPQVTQACKALRDHFRAEGEDPAAIKSEVETQEQAGRSGLPGLAPLAHLHLIVAEVEIGAAPMTEQDALEVAQAKVRAAQMRGEVLRENPPQASDRGCKLARMRAADPSITYFELADEPKPVPVSRAGAARWYYGRRARRGFYAHLLGGDDLLVTDSLEDMVAPWPGEDKEPKDCRFTPPLALQNKIAVLYADGNGFGAIRRKFGLERFSKELLKLQRERLLRPLVAEIRARMASQDVRVAKRFAGFDKKDGLQARFETLLWGGDELIWVVPSWLGLWLAEQFFNLTKGWEIDGHVLTFGAGLVFANHKTPIRDLKVIADELAGMAKRAAKADPGDNNVGLLEIEVLESVDPPLDGVSGVRERQLGLWDRGEEDHHPLIHALALPGEGLADVFARLRQAKNEKGNQYLPRSLVQRILKEVTRLRGGAAENGEKAVATFEEWRQRFGTVAPTGKTGELLDVTGQGYEEDSAALDLYQLYRLDDYLGPFPGDPGVAP